MESKRDMLLVGLLDYLHRNGGVTVKNNEIMQYTKGYQIASSNGIEVKSQSLNSIIEVIEKMNLESFGIWLDGDYWYLDTTSFYESNIDIAIELGRKYNQIAIFNWETMESIRL